MRRRSDPTPALVLLPGLDGTGRLFDAFVAALGPEVETIVARYPTQGAMTYAALEPIARAFLPADRPCVLLAESFSGPIALSIAASAPPGLVGLVLSCSFARGPAPWLDLFRPFMDWIPIHPWLPRIVTRLALGAFDRPELADAIAAALADVPMATLRARGNVAFAADVTPLLARIVVPVVYLQATQDRFVPRESAALIATHAPQTRIVEMNAPHFLLQAIPDHAAEVVRDALRRWSAPPASGRAHAAAKLRAIAPVEGSATPAATSGPRGANRRPRRRSTRNPGEAQ